jgi:hypothetical protein
LNVKQNINIVNALIRITVGLTVVAWSTAKLVKRPWRDSWLIMAMLGAMKVAEGIVRFCPLTLLYERYAQNEQKQHISGSCASRDSMEGLMDEQPVMQ